MFHFPTSRFWSGVLFIYVMAIAGTDAKQIASKSSGFLSPSEMEVISGFFSTRLVKRNVGPDALGALPGSEGGIGVYGRHG